MSKRILIIKPSALGDVATTLPLLCDLHAAMPEAQIDWLVHPAFSAILERHDALHQIIPFDRKALAAWWYKPAAFRLFKALIRRLRENQYDLVIDAQGLFRSGFLARATGAKMRIGFGNAREGAPFFYTHKVRMFNGGRQIVAVERMRELGRPLNLRRDLPVQFRVPLQPLAKSKATELLDSPPFHGADAFVAVIPGARWNTKRWPAERYGALVRQLNGKGHAVVLLGSPDEKNLCDQIEHAAAQDHGAALNLAGKTDLATMIAVLARARLVVGNDSGPLHVAVALGRPIVALYGPTDPNFVGPFGQIDQVLRHPVPCHPCRRRECDHHSCMNGLAVELVWEKTQRQLSR